MARLVMRDVSRSGHPLGAASITGLPDRLTLGAVLRARIEGEVGRYNADPGPVYTGLVQPEDAVRYSDGFRMQAPRTLDPGRLVTAAFEAVAAGLVSFEVDGRPVTDLDHEVEPDAVDEIVVILHRPVVARAGASGTGPS